MKRRHCMYGIIALLLLFTGCNRTSISQIDEPIEKMTQPCETSFHGTLSEYKRPSDSVTHGSIIGRVYDGEIKLPNDLDALPLLELKKEGYASYCVDGIEYIVLLYSSRTSKSLFASGWLIQVDTLSPIAKATSGEIILMPDCDDSPILCVYDRSSDEVHCFLRKDFEENGICTMELDNFDVYVDGCLIPKDEKINLIWKMHTSNENYPEGYPHLDGDWKYYSIRLAYRDCPALQYEMNFAIIEGLLYIDNLLLGELKCIPAEQVIGQGTVRSH